MAEKEQMPWNVSELEQEGLGPAQNEQEAKHHQDQAQTGAGRTAGGAAGATGGASAGAPAGSDAPTG